MKNIILIAGLLASMGLFAAKNAETVSHKIQPKETLFRISLMYNSTVADIEKANPGINPKTVKAGSTIKVPKDTKIRDAAFVETFLSDKLVFTPISQIATLIKPEKQTAAIPVSQQMTSEAKTDENPFLTPSDPRTGPIADEQPVKEEKANEPSMASKDEEAIEDENPFVTPKHKGSTKP